jgi:hypothetical protein
MNTGKTPIHVEIGCTEQLSQGVQSIESADCHNDFNDDGEGLSGEMAPPVWIISEN